MKKYKVVNKRLPNAAGPQDDVPVYFVHIPKTAGSTLRVIHHRKFGDGVAPGWTWRDLLKLSETQLRTYRLFTGHYYTCIHHAAPWKLRYYTFLREPISRALSHYAHVKRDPGHYLHRRAAELGSLRRYLEDPETAPTVSNFQTRMLALDVNPVELAKSLSPAQLENYELERRLETGPDADGDEQLLLTATARLQQFCFVGITERFDDSLRALCWTFGWEFPGDIEPTNVNQNRPRLSDVAVEDLHLLREMNRVDTALYGNAAAEFAARYEDMAKQRNGGRRLISYAQNGEDVMLHRALGHIRLGTYVDVGANDPVTDSVTKLFYDRGWRGMNLEPVPSWHARLQEARPDDLNLPIAAASDARTIRLYEVVGTGLSTMDGARARDYESAGQTVRLIDVPTERLDDLLTRYGFCNIHFLKIDVEGAEQSVLSGLDLERHRPWIIIIEATRVNTPAPAHEGWEHMLLSHRYEFAYFDGLNRFYLAAEHAELRSYLSTPPNVFDGFVRYAEWNFEREAWRLKSELAAVYASRSWRALEPVRRCMAALRRVRALLK